MPQTLLPIFSEDATPITDIVSFQKRDGKVWYFQGCLPVFSHEETDYQSFKIFTSSLIEMGQCKQVDIVRAFGVSPISVKRQVKKYREGGVKAFFSQRKQKRCTVWTPERLSRAQELLDEGKSRKEVEAFLEIKPDTLYRAIHSGQLTEQKKTAKTRVNEA